MKPRKILIVRLGAMGDIIHTLPAQQSLHAALPETAIHWLTEPPFRSLLQTVPGIERVWTADTKGWRRGPKLWGDASRLRTALRKERFDVAIDFQGLLKSAILSKLSGAVKILGFTPERFKESAAGWFYDSKINGEADLSRHVNDTNLRLASLLSGTTNASGIIPFELPNESDENISRLLQEHSVDRPPVLLNPGAGWATKIWPAEKYARLGEEIRTRLGLPVIFTYGPREEALVAQIRADSGQQVISFPTDILGLAALSRRSRLMVAGDTGPLHLAAAVGTPTVAIMGPTSRTRNGSFDDRDEVVQMKLHCSDCYKRRCDVFYCMNIPVFEVLRAVARRLRQTD